MFNVAVVPATLDGFAVTVSPLGAPPIARFTAPAKPLLRTSVIVAEPFPPCAMLTLLADNDIEKLGVVELNVATTFVDAAAAVTTHDAFAPEQAPDQPPKTLPAAAAAVSVTLVPGAKPAAQVPPQLMPAGPEVTVPEPVPVRDTFTRG